MGKDCKRSIAHRHRIYHMCNGRLTRHRLLLPLSGQEQVRRRQRFLSWISKRANSEHSQHPKGLFLVAACFCTGLMIPILPLLVLKESEISLMMVIYWYLIRAKRAVTSKVFFNPLYLRIRQIQLGNPAM